MQNLNICAQTHVENSATYCGIAYDGEFFYMSAPICHEVHKYSKAFELVEIIATSAKFSSLCYDSYSGCFWAVAQCELGRIFRLNSLFQKIGDISVRDGRNTPLQLSSVAMKDSQNLIVCGNFGVAELHKNCPIAAVYSRDCLQTVPSSAVTHCKNCYITAICTAHGQSLCCGLFCDNEQIQSVLPTNYQIRDIAACSAEAGVFYLLATRDYRFNYAIRCELCSAKCENISPCDEYRQSLGGVISSISKIEESIAEILSAESRKIRKVLLCTDDCAEIIRINESVNKTISQVTQLEQVLCSKMNMARDFYNEI